MHNFGFWGLAISCVEVFQCFSKQCSWHLQHVSLTVIVWCEVSCMIGQTEECSAVWRGKQHGFLPSFLFNYRALAIEHSQNVNSVDQYNLSKVVFHILPVLLFLQVSSEPHGLAHWISPPSCAFPVMLLTSHWTTTASLTTHNSSLSLLNVINPADENCSVCWNVGKTFSIQCG